MGKVFITDEVNDTYTADVTNAGKVKVELGAASFLKLSSAQTIVSGTTAATSPCYLKSILVGSLPATATTIGLWDTAVSAGNLSAFGTTGANCIALLTIDTSAGISAAGGAMFPAIFPFDVYCASGLAISIGMSAGATDGGSRVGCVKGVTIVYQT